MPTDENKALIQRYLGEVMNGHDADACAAFFAPDSTNHGRPVGREGLRQVHRDIFATFPDWHNTIEEMTAEGDTVVCRNTTTATHLGTPTVIPIHNMGGVSPTGKSVVMQSIHIFHIADGLIASHRAMRDDLETMEQIGLWPPAALHKNGG